MDSVDLSSVPEKNSHLANRLLALFHNIMESSRSRKCILQIRDHGSLGMQCNARVVQIYKRGSGTRRRTSGTVSRCAVAFVISCRSYMKWCSLLIHLGHVVAPISGRGFVRLSQYHLCLLPLISCSTPGVRDWTILLDGARCNTDSGNWMRKLVTYIQICVSWWADRLSYMYALLALLPFQLFHLHLSIIKQPNIFNQTEPVKAKRQQ